MRTKILAMLVCLMMFLTIAANARATDYTPIVQEELSALQLNQVQDYLGRLDQDIKNLLPQWNPEQWAKKGLGFRFPQCLQEILQIVAKEVLLNLRLLVQIIVLAAVSSLLHRLQVAWISENVTDLAFGLTYLVMAGLAVGSFVTTLSLARETLESVSTFIYALLPTVFSLLVAAGGLTTVTVLHPLLLAGTGLVIQAVRDYLLPLAYLSGVIGLVGHLAEGFSLSRLSSLLRQVVIGGLGLLMSIFLGIISIQGISAAVADGVSLRTAKYLTGTFIPVVGGALADSMELAAGCSLLLKNTLGTFGALVILLICLIPMIKIYIISLIYRLASALAQPLGNERLSLALQEIANTFVMVFGAVAIVGLMFFISLTILVGVGNISTMLR
jgi:stage III sporulation protein AE